MLVLVVGTLAWGWTNHWFQPATSRVNGSPASATVRPVSTARSGPSSQAQLGSLATSGAITATATPPVTKTPKPASLNEALQPLVKQWNDQLGDFGYVVYNLDKGDKVTFNADKNFETASLYKLYVMASVYYDIWQGNITLDTPITLTPDAADEEEDGFLIVDVGDSLPVRDLLDAMITKSNNTASLMLLFETGIPRLREIVANLGFNDSDLSDSYDFKATPNDISGLLARLANQKLFSPTLDQQMVDLLSRDTIRDRIPALLPPNTKVANKTGNLDNVINDAGIVYLPNGQRLVIVVMTNNFTNADAPVKFISQLSLAAYNYYAG